ncbi:MAG TPA: alpha-N-arabinofuranosidase [Clostridiales bacterium]|nr:alpha-N-arabinofuranosidase [Clostridiales bacterium]
MKHLIINASRKYSHINRNIYGHFSEHLGRGIYGGIYVGEDSEIPNIHGIRQDVVEALRYIKVPVIRWPGGCFAEYYNWKDGIGPKEERRRIVNKSWGGVVEDNSFGTHEFLDFCELVGCSPYIVGNVASGTARELSEWIEYINSDDESLMADLRRKNGRDKPWNVQYIGIGNENWGCGGQMRPEYYADVYRQFATCIRTCGGTKPYKIACGADGPDYKWTEVLMRLAGNYMDSLSLHYYTMPGYYTTDEYKWEKKGPATGFDESNYYRTLRRALFIDELICRHKYIMDQYDPDKRVSITVDEWGTWHAPEPGTNPAFLYQQNTMRDAIVAAVSLNIFNSHSDRVKMANLAQMINVLQAVILTEGNKMVLTPTYHVYDLYKGHQDSTLIESYVQQDMIGTEEAQVPAVHVSASEARDGSIRVTLVNLSASESQRIRCLLCSGEYHFASVRYISGEMNDCNEFDKPPRVSVKTMPDIQIEDNSFIIDIPACSVNEIVLR